MGAEIAEIVIIVVAVVGFVALLVLGFKMAKKELTCKKCKKKLHYENVFYVEETGNVTIQQDGSVKKVFRIHLKCSCGEKTSFTLPIVTQSVQKKLGGDISIKTTDVNAAIKSYIDSMSR